LCYNRESAGHRRRSSVRKTSAGIGHMGDDGRGSAGIRDWR
jgi:hypothetical protein